MGLKGRVLFASQQTGDGFDYDKKLVQGVSPHTLPHAIKKRMGFCWVACLLIMQMILVCETSYTAIIQFVQRTAMQRLLEIMNQFLRTTNMVINNSEQTQLRTQNTEHGTLVLL